MYVFICVGVFLFSLQCTYTQTEGVHEMFTNTRVRRFGSTFPGSRHLTFLLFFACPFKTFRAHTHTHAFALLQLMDFSVIIFNNFWIDFFVKTNNNGSLKFLNASKLNLVKYVLLLSLPLALEPEHFRANLSPSFSLCLPPAERSAYSLSPIRILAPFRAHARFEITLVFRISFLPSFSTHTFASAAY